MHRTQPGLREAAARDGGDKHVHAHFTPAAEVPCLDALRDEAWRVGLPPAGGDGAALPSSRFICCQHPWRGRGLDLGDDEDAAYVRRVSDNLFAVLAASARAAAAAHAPLSGHEREVAAHALLAARRARAFAGRSALRAAASRMLDPPPAAEPGRPHVVFGASGVGKTSLLAAAVVDASGGGNSVTVMRFGGTSAASSDVRALLRSVCAQIAAAYDRALGDLPAPLEALAAHWAKLMGTCASAARPLRVALDSLDQLSNDGGACSRVWGWLPRTLPPHVSLLVSTLADERYGILAQLHRGLEPDSFLEVGRLDPSESGPLLTALLGAHRPPWPPRSCGRRVTAAQMACLEAAAVGRGEGAAGGGATALQLQLLTGEGARWRSWDAPPADLPSTVEGLLQRLYTRLEDEHGAALVRLALGLLAVRRGAMAILFDLVIRIIILYYYSPPAPTVKRDNVAATAN